MRVLFTSVALCGHFYPLVPLAWTFRALGHDVLTLAVLGLAGRRLPDEEVLATAAGERRAVLTHNRLHFVRLHRRMPQHAGIVISSHARDPIAQAERIEAVLLTLPDLTARLVRVNLADHTIE